MMYWTIDAAKKSKLINSFVISSESDKIINIAKKYKVKLLKDLRNYQKIMYIKLKL